MKRDVLLGALLSAALLFAVCPAQAALYSPVASFGTPGTPTSCGVSPTVSGTDGVGTVTVGTGVSVLACTLPFSGTLQSAPVCTANAVGGTAVTINIASVSASSVTFGLSVTLGGGQFTYMCFIK